MAETPYSVLTEDSLTYRIVLSREQKGMSFASIGRELGVSATRAANLYGSWKYRQARLYVSHLSIALDRDIEELRQELWQADMCYRREDYVCGYFEKKYPELLRVYRGGEPGMPQSFLDKIPPLQVELPQETCDRIVELRDQGLTSGQVGRILNLTKDRVRQEYDKHYLAKVQALCDQLSSGLSGAERKELWDRCFENHATPRTAYLRLLADRDGGKKLL